MKNGFKARVIALLLAAALFSGLLVTAASAERAYIFPDSDTKKLTENELWGWDYESLGYALNEIFARHGFVFQKGGRYDRYFSSMPWYTPNDNPDNRTACYPQLNSVEWANQSLIKKVRQDMANQKTTNPTGKSIWDYYEPGFDKLIGFEPIKMKANNAAVYSAPSITSWRGANGNAKVNRNGTILAAGKDNGWLLVMYETNKGSVRVGYINPSEYGRALDANGKDVVTELEFENTEAEITEDCFLTDDPATSRSVIRQMKKGETVTYLTNFFNHSSWAYIETMIDGKVVRGFVPADCVSENQETVGAAGNSLKNELGVG